MATPTTEQQTAIDERQIDNSELEKALEDREVAKGGASEARKKYTTLDEVVKDKIEELDLSTDDTVRVGRFVIRKTATQPREVSFTAEAGERLTIKPDPTE